MINEIAPAKYDNSFKDIEPRLGDIILCYKDNRILVRRTYDHLELPAFIEIVEARHLFDIDDKRFFHVDYNDLYTLDDSYEFIETRALRNVDDIHGLNDKIMSYAAVCGLHYNYFITHAKYCGVCGDKMVRSRIEMANICPTCSNTKYPDIMPAIAVAIINDDRILLTKYKGRLNVNYALVAGYCEVGESLEECVKREAKEETGLDLYDIKYYMSQPWGFSNTMMIGFIAKSYNDNIVLQEDELGFAGWFKREDVEVLDNPTSMSHKMIQDFRLKKI